MQKLKRPELPIIGLIGPTNLQRISQASGIPESRYRDAAYQAGRAIARTHAMLTIVPDRGVAVFNVAWASCPWVAVSRNVGRYAGQKAKSDFQSPS